MTGVVQAAEREGVALCKADAAALARHRLQRTPETLHEADLLRDANAREGAVNRYYYAAFYAAGGRSRRSNCSPEDAATSPRSSTAIW